VEPDHIAADVVGQGEGTRGEIVGDYGAAWITSLAPYPKGSFSTVDFGVICLRVAEALSCRPPVRCSKTKCGAHLISTQDEGIAGEAVHDEPVLGVVVELDRQRAIPPGVAWAGDDHAVVPDNVATQLVGDDTEALARVCLTVSATRTRAETGYIKAHLGG
jgi:hypothetical protein